MTKYRHNSFDSVNLKKIYWFQGQLIRDVPLSTNTKRARGKQTVEINRDKSKLTKKGAKIVKIN